MLCQSCKQQEATHHSRVFLNGFSREIHLCAECAQKTPYDTELILPSLLAQLMGLGGGQPALRTPNACPQCGLTPAELRHTGRCGCALCYDHFHLAPSILHAYGRAGHTGRVPAPDAKAHAQAGKRRRREQLKAEMQDAVAAQAFERAAELRDELKKLEGGDTV